MGSGITMKSNTEKGPEWEIEQFEEEAERDPTLALEVLFVSRR